MNPTQAYQQKLQQHDVVYDEAQEAVVQQLQHFYTALSTRRQSIWLHWRKRHQPATGVYLWGDVGTGKSFLMNLFIECLPRGAALRLHFHAFMQQVHELMIELQGQSDPLLSIAKTFAKQAQVLCFDEFMVHDITDAMIFARLLQALFDQGVSLFATSNIKPGDLYLNGLQRQQFLPAIALIQENTAVIELNHQVDYRLRRRAPGRQYFFPLDKTAKRHMIEAFYYYAQGEGERRTIHLVNREVPTIRVSDETIWFDFSVLCGKGRSQADYLALVRQFKTVLLSGVPVLEGQRKTQVRFVALIDVLYDAHVRLIMSAEVSLAQLATVAVGDAFRRSHSRLVEMQGW